MTLEEVRKHIDALDPGIRELLMKRMDCSVEVAKAKYAEHSTTVFRADREQEILARLGSDVPEDRKASYLAITKKIMEASRMYQYGLLYDWNGEEAVFTPLLGNLAIPDTCSRIKIRITRDNRPGSMAAILSMIGDYGFDMESMDKISEDDTVTFDMLLLGDLHETSMKKLLFQLSREVLSFEVLEIS